jgi:hypothetical protein
VRCRHSPIRVQLADAPSHSRGTKCPSFARYLTLCRNRGRREGRAPAGTRSPVCEKTRTGGPQVKPGHPSLPCADGFNGFLRALPGETSSIAPVACGSFLRSPGRDRCITAKLDASVGRQDHTASPSAHIPVRIPDGWRALTIEAERGRFQRRVVSRQRCSRSTPLGFPPCNCPARRRRRGHRLPARVP